MRSSILVETEDLSIAIDVGPDFRQQMLRIGQKKLDAILITHEHADHIMGLDDVRPFNFMQRKDMPVYATASVAENLKTRFDYVFAANKYPGAPMVKLHSIDKNTPFKIANLRITPIEVIHGTLPVLGFRFGDFTYLTDVKTIQTEELEKVRGTRYLVLNALHHSMHFTHLNLEEAIALSQRIQPEFTYFSHTSHNMGRYAEISKELPEGMQLAYDGLVLSVE